MNSIKDKMPNWVKEWGMRALKFVAFYLVVILFIGVFLRIYTHHGQSLSVPDFSGMMPDRVEEIAKHTDLRIKIIDSTFVDYLPGGCVVDQNPKPGIAVKRNRTIFITTNAYQKAQVEVPKLVGLSYRQGKAMLEMYGLRVGMLIYRPDFAKNNILQQMYDGKPIAAGTRLNKGECIDLILGDGYGSNSVALPNLVGLSYFNAINEINDAFFNVGTITYDETVVTAYDSINAIVVRQEPAYYSDARGNMGSSIKLWMTAKDPQPQSPQAINLND